MPVLFEQRGRFLYHFDHFGAEESGPDRRRRKRGLIKNDYLTNAHVSYIDCV